MSDESELLSGWKKLQMLSVSVGSLLIPVVLAFSGYEINKTLKESDMAMEYISLAIDVLKAEPAPRYELIQWAKATVHHFSDIDLPNVSDDSVKQESLYNPRAVLNRADLIRVKSDSWVNGVPIELGFQNGTSDLINQVLMVADRLTEGLGVNFQQVQDPREALVRVKFLEGDSWSYFGREAVGIPVDNPTLILDPSLKGEPFTRQAQRQLLRALGADPDSKSLRTRLLKLYPLIQNGS